MLGVLFSQQLTSMDWLSRSGTGYSRRPSMISVETVEEYEDVETSPTAVVRVVRTDCALDILRM